MTTEKLIKAIDINNEITRLKSYLVDLKSAKEIKGTAGLSCGGSHNVTIKYEYIEPIIDRLIQETEDNIRLFKRRFENL